MVPVFFQPTDALGTVIAIDPSLLQDALREIPAKAINVIVVDPVVEVLLHKALVNGLL